MNKIQCPHCFTDYKISDEQLHQSQGVVRCGKCMETFDAYTAQAQEERIFDPRNAFIEPASHFESDQNIKLDDILPDSRKVEFKDGSVVNITKPESNPLTSETQAPIEKFELNEILKEAKRSKQETSHTNSSEELARPRINENSLKNIKDSFDPSLSVHFDDDEFSDNDVELTDTLEQDSIHSVSQSASTYIDEPSVSHHRNDSSYVMEASTFLAQNNEHITEESIQFADNDDWRIDEPSIQIIDKSKREPSLFGDEEENVESQFELEIDDIEQLSETLLIFDERDNDQNNESVSQKEPDVETKESDEEDEKLVNLTEEDDGRDKRLAPRSSETDDLFGEAKSKSIVRRIFRVLFWLPVYLILIALFSAFLIYQLWQKQFISWPDSPQFQTLIEPVRVPVLNKLNEFGITIPTRRNLSALELLSAKTEAHPSRASTILLRVSLINRAEIDQPLPWLELSLKNANGSVISRRSLSPKKYIHNNRLTSNVGARELKKITIELLSFPKQAVGYELKLLNK